jgi:hypothetical protein
MHHIFESLLCDKPIKCGQLGVILAAKINRTLRNEACYARVQARVH